MVMLWALISCAEIRAQEILKVSNDSIALQEVVVKAARVVNKEDGKLIFPSDIQKQRSFSGFSLLGKLALPHIRVDEAGRSISATDHKGEVQIRINGILANIHDVQMLDVASIMSVDYIDSPGVRYGKNIAYIAEAIYENRLKPFTFSAGTNLNWKYMDNQYLGDVVSENGIRSLGIYGFAQIKGSLGQFKEGTSRLTYVAGFGLSNQSYRQGDEEFSFWLCCPKLTLAYSLTSSFQIRLGSELSQHISQIAMISDTRIRKNSMEWTVGNPSLKPSSRYENWVVFSFSKPRINTDFTLNYRINRHCDLAKYTRTENDQFLYSQTNQPHCNMLYLTNDTRFDIIPDHLIFSVNAGIYRFFNKGDEYSHCYTAYNYGGTLQGYWGKWTVMLYADNGWNFMEGENIGHNPPSLAASASYHIGDFDFTLYMHNPFMAHPKSYSALIPQHYSLILFISA